MATKRPAWVEVTWLDARGWNLDELPLEEIPGRVGLRLRRSGGWLVYRGPDFRHPEVEILVLATDNDPPETDDDKEEWGDFNVIPAGWVKRIVYKSRRRKDGTKQTTEHERDQATVTVK
jgi:hypothetical protein